MRTTLDPKLQTAARMALMNGLETYDRRHGWRGAWGHVDIAPGWESGRAEDQAAGRAPRLARRRGRVAGGEVTGACSPTAATGELVAADVAWAKAGKGLNAGDLVFVEPRPRAAASTCARCRR